MKKLFYIPFLIFTIFGCSSELSLQKYMAKNSENNNFIAVDLGSDILKINQKELSEDEKEALNSFKKLNILAFKKNEDNEALYKKEKEEVQTILKGNPSYEQLMSFGSGAEGASIYAVGETSKISEFIIFGNQNKMGFAIVRIIGKDMSPNHIMNFLSLLDKADIDGEQLKALEGLIKKDGQSLEEDEIKQV